MIYSTLIVSLISAATLVRGHGLLVNPLSRSNASDPTFANTVTATKELCHGLPTGTAFETVSVSRINPLMDVSWLIFAPHNGSCTFSISYDNGKSFAKVAEDPNCASKQAVYTARIDMGKDFKTGNAILRWVYNGANNETYESCSDLVIQDNTSKVTQANITSIPSPSSMDAPRTLNVNLIREKGNLLSLFAPTSQAGQLTGSLAAIGGPANTSIPALGNSATAQSFMFGLALVPLAIMLF